MRYLPWNRPSEWADRICMRDSNGELTYADVSRRVEAIAGSSPQWGCAPVTSSR